MRKSLLVFMAVALACGVYCLRTKQEQPIHTKSQAQLEETNNRLEFRDEGMTTVGHREQEGDRPLELNDTRLQRLEAKLNALEAERDTRVREAAGKSEKVARPKTKVTENELGEWMETSLLSGAPDREWNVHASKQIEQGLTTLPGVKLQTVDCGSRFGRARFVRDDGKVPELHELFGVAPFASEGFTVDDGNGTVAVYFTRPGTSLQDLRREALAEHML